MGKKCLRHRKSEFHLPTELCFLGLCVVTQEPFKLLCNFLIVERCRTAQQRTQVWDSFCSREMWNMQCNTLCWLLLGSTEKYDSCKFSQKHVRTTHIGDCTYLYNYAGVRTPIIQWTVHFLLKWINSNTCTEYSELEGALSPTLKWMAVNTGIKHTSLALLESCSNQLILHHWQNLILKVHLPSVSMTLNIWPYHLMNASARACCILPPFCLCIHVKQNEKHRLWNFPILDSWAV